MERKVTMTSNEMTNVDASSPISNHNDDLSNDSMNSQMDLTQSKANTQLSLSRFHHNPAPFSIRWISGYNPKVHVINLNKDGSTQLFYAAVNCCVIYNWTMNEMKILQGHKHIVSYIASSEDAKWLVTADSGPENIIIIWETSNHYPYKTIFLPHGNRHLALIALSADAKYLLTIAYHEKAEIFWWIWSFGLNTPHAKIEVDVPPQAIVAAKFDPTFTKYFVLMTKQDIWIGVAAKVIVNERGVIKETDDWELKLRKIEKKRNPDQASLTCFTFVKNTRQILVTTSKGAILVYGYTMNYNEKIVDPDFDKLKFVKALRLEEYKINVIISIDSLIVTGNQGGEIRFYDEHLMLLYWVHGFKPDCIEWLSFNVAPRNYEILDPLCNKRCLCWEKVVLQTDKEGNKKQMLMKSKLPKEATCMNKPFVVRDFIVCTKNEGVGFVDFVTEKMYKVIDYRISPATALTVHPQKPFVCVGFKDGSIDLYNFIDQRLTRRVDLRQTFTVVIPPDEDSLKAEYERRVPELGVTCLQYAPSGLHLACGLNTGGLLFFDPTTLDMLSTAATDDSRYPITEIKYSPDSLTLATSNTGRTVCVYRYDCDYFVWTFVGKHRAHYKDIATVFFPPRKNENGDYKLLSLGEDRMMVEYDIGASKDGKLEIFSLDRFQQTSVPLAGIVWPNPKDLDPNVCREDLPVILVANDEYKYQLINYDTTMILSTVLGPRYDSPVRKVILVTVKSNDEECQYLVFATKTVIGLQKMPLDGNPWKHCGILGHPKQITEWCYRDDLGILFTIGQKDTCMMQWTAKYSSPDSTTKRGGDDLDPYYCLIENGRPGWLFQEIRDLFYYIQILCQGIFSPAMRRVKDFIPIDSLADLMRAIGFYPSEYEVENLFVEAKYKVYQKQPSTEIDFEEFVKLYLNHRPAFGDDFFKVKEAFQYFANSENGNLVIQRNDFIDILSDYGECFSKELSWYLLSILSGYSFDDRAQMNEAEFSFLPKEISFKDFVRDFLGIDEITVDSEEVPAQHHQSHQATGSIDNK